MTAIERLLGISHAFHRPHFWILTPASLVLAGSMAERVQQPHDKQGADLFSSIQSTGRSATAVASTLVAVAGLSLSGAPTAAADERASFDLKYGATYFRGTVEFYNRSVTVQGQIRGLSGTSCRHGGAWANIPDTAALDHRITGQVCNGPVPREIKLTADVRGGARYVQVDLLDPDGLGDPLDWCIVERGDEYCERP